MATQEQLKDISRIGQDIDSDRIASLIVSELVEIAGEDQLSEYAESEHGDLTVHRSLVQTRLGGDYSRQGWDRAMDLIRARHEAAQ